MLSRGFSQLVRGAVAQTTAEITSKMPKAIHPAQIFLDSLNSPSALNKQGKEYGMFFRAMPAGSDYIQLFRDGIKKKRNPKSQLDYDSLDRHLIWSNNSNFISFSDCPARAANALAHTSGHEINQFDLLLGIPTRYYIDIFLQTKGKLNQDVPIDVHDPETGEWIGRTHIRTGGGSTDKDSTIAYEHERAVYENYDGRRAVALLKNAYFYNGKLHGMELFKNPHLSMSLLEEQLKIHQPDHTIIVTTVSDYSKLSTPRAEHPGKCTAA